MSKWRLCGKKECGWRCGNLVYAWILLFTSVRRKTLNKDFGPVFLLVQIWMWRTLCGWRLNRRL